MIQISTNISGKSQINHSHQQSHCGLLKTKQNKLLFSACQGAVAHLTVQRGNLTVPILCSAQHEATAMTSLLVHLCGHWVRALCLCGEPHHTNGCAWG